MKRVNEVLLPGWFGKKIQEVSSERRRIFAVAYKAKYLGGDIHPSDYIKEYRWVALKTLKPEDYFIGGWLEGVKEYIRTFQHS